MRGVVKPKWHLTLPNNIFRGVRTKRKLSTAIFYTSFIVTGMLLLVAGVALALDHSIAVKSATRYVESLTGLGSSQFETRQNFSFDQQVTLVFSSPNPIQINVTVTELSIADSYSYDPGVNGPNFTLTYQGYQYLPVESDAGIPIMVVVTRPPATPFTINVTVTEQTGFPRFVDAPGYLVPAVISFLLGTALLFQLAIRDVEHGSLFQVSPILRDSGLIAGSSFFLGLLAVLFSVLKEPTINEFFRILFPVILPLVYLIFRKDLWLKLKQNIFIIPGFALAESGLISSLDFSFNSLASYSYGFWITGSPHWLNLTLGFLSLVTIVSTGVFLLTVPLTHELLLFLKIRRTKLFQVMRFARKLERLLEMTLPIKYQQIFLEKNLSETSDAMLTSWRSEPFIQFILQLDLEIRNGNITIFRPDFGLFLLPLVQQEGGFNLTSKPLWVPNFCANKACKLVIQGDIPFNACLVTQAKGYATQKFTPREIEIMSIALFLRDGDKRELLHKIAGGIINVRFPEHCRGCANLDFIREEGSGALPDRPEIEIN